MLPENPAAAQLPAEAHETDATVATPNAADPGTSIAVPHEPFFSLTKNASGALAREVPATAQLPAEAQDTEPTPADMLVFNAADPGTSIALPQEPFFSLTTNACSSPALE